MLQVSFRFYAELNDLLAPPRTRCTLTHGFEVGTSVKDAIEAFGVPHTEVDLILVNGEAAPFSRQMQDGDRISVFPLFRSIGLDSIVSLQPRIEGEICFVLDTHLGRLAAYLRMLGFDTLYRNDYPDTELAEISASQHRTLLSKDRGLLKRNRVTRGYLIREEDPKQQVLEVVQRFQLAHSLSPFRRCLRCNALLRPAGKELLSARLLPETRRYYNEFHICPECDRIYWKGSHYERMNSLIRDICSGRDELMSSIQRSTRP